MDITEKSIKFIKEKQKELIEKYANLLEFPTSDNPWAFFMAGSPGAGKTEVSKSIIEENSKINPETKIVRIDADEIRSFIPDYTGQNSDKVQRAASLGVQKIFDSVIKRRQNFILDGTFSHYKVSRDNMERCIKHGMRVGVFYVYQDPFVAWNFTKFREKAEGRFIPKKVFIEDFFIAKENVNKIKEEFKEKINVDLIIKNYENKTEKIEFGIDKVDSFLKNEYNPESLESLLK